MSAELITLRGAEESKESVQLDWYSEIEQTAKQAGVPLFEHVICRPTTTVRSRDSKGTVKVVGAGTAYTTLKDFVSAISLPGRPNGFDWAEWELKARAATIAKQYNISADFHPQEVIEFYADAEQHLDREPADAQELWHVLTLTNKNRSDARIAELKRNLEQLQETKDLNDAKVDELRGDISKLTSLLGEIPNDFSDRFGTASNLVDLYQNEKSQRQALKAELNETFLELKSNAEQIKELKLKLDSEVSAETDLTYQARLDTALNEAEQAQRFLKKLQERRNESSASVEQKQKTIDLLRGLNKKLTAVIREKNNEISVVTQVADSRKALNRKLTTRIREQKVEMASVSTTASEERVNRIRLMAQLQKARQAKTVALFGLALVGSFTASIVAYIVFV